MKKTREIFVALLIPIIIYIFFFSTPWSAEEKATAIEQCHQAKSFPQDIDKCTCYVDYVSKHISYSNFRSGTYIGNGFNLNPFAYSAFDISEAASNACVAVVEPSSWN